jgi:hypothetical protein
MTDRTAKAKATASLPRSGSAGVALVKAALVLAATATALAPVSARAGLFDGWAARRDDCAPGTRHARGEYACEHARSRHLNDLDCAGLAAYAESERYRYNRQTLPLYLLPGGGAGTRPATTTTPAPSSLLNQPPMPTPRAEPMIPRTNTPPEPTPPPPPPPPPTSGAASPR